MLLAAVLCACGSTNPEPTTAVAEPKAQPPSAADAELPTTYRGQEPALANASALNVLPDQTMAAIFLRSPRSIAAAIESTAIFRDYGALYNDAARTHTLPGGAHLWEAETWGAFGVDIDAPAGAAFWVEERAVGVFFVSLADAELFQQSMAELAVSLGLPAPLVGQLSSATVMRFNSGAPLAIVSRDDIGMLIVADRSDDISKAVDTLAGVHGASNLAASGRVARAFAGLDYGEDLAGFVAFDTIAARIASDDRARQDDDWYSSEINRLEVAIEAAKTSQRPQSEIDLLETELSSRLTDHNRYQLRQSGEARINSDLVQPLGTIGFGIDLDGKDSRARAQLHPPADSLFARLFTRNRGALKLPSRLGETPLFVLGAQVSPAAAGELLDIALQAEGETRGSSFAALQAETGIDPKQVLDLLQGEVSGALTLNRQAFLAAVDTDEGISSALGMHLLFQVSDAEAARALLAEAIASPGLEKYSAGQGGRLALEIPGFNRRKIRIELADDLVEVRTVDAPIEEQRFSSQESALLASANNAAIMLIDPIVLSWLAVGTKSYSGDYARRTSPMPDKTRERMTEIKEEEARLKRAVHALQSQQAIAASQDMGRLVMSLRPQRASFALLATLSGKSANLGRALQRYIESMVPSLESARRGTPSEIEELRGQLRKLDDERWRLMEETSP